MPAHRCSLAGIAAHGRWAVVTVETVIVVQD
jgi:hypothetical protein